MGSRTPLALAALLLLAAAAAPARAAPGAGAAAAVECSTGAWDLRFQEADGLLDDDTFRLYQEDISEMITAQHAAELGVAACPLAGVRSVAACARDHEVDAAGEPTRYEYSFDFKAKYACQGGPQFRSISAFGHVDHRGEWLFTRLGSFAPSGAF